jgi:hypothetical protein
VEVSGDLQKRFFRLGRTARIPGHLHIEVFDENGVQLAKKSNSYKLRSAYLRQVHFIETVPVQLEDVAKVRLRHHSVGRF